MEGAKAELEKRVSRLLKFVQGKNKNTKETKRELVALVKDLQDRSEELFRVVDDLKLLSDKKSRRKGKSNDARPTFSSDSEYSSEESNNNPSNNDKENTRLKEEVQALLQKLTNAWKDREALNSEYVATLEKLRQAETTNKKLENELSKKELETQSEGLSAEAKSLEENNNHPNFQIVEEPELDATGNRDGIWNSGSEPNSTSRMEDLMGEISNDEMDGQVDGKEVEAAQHEVALVLSQKKEMAHLLELRNGEIYRMQSQLKSLEEKNEGLLTQVQNLERQLSYLQEQNKDMEDVMGSTSTELVSLESKKNQLESQLEKDKLDYMQSLSQMEEQVGIRIAEQQRILEEQKKIILGLTNKVQEQERDLKEQKDTIIKFNEEQKLNKKPKWNQAQLERKMEELAQDFRMKMEDHIRILNRRIHVAEQIHIENKTNLMKSRNKNGTEDGEDPPATHQSYFSKIKDMLQLIHTLPPGFDLAIKKLGEEANFADRISKVGGVVKLATKWVSEKNHVVKELEQEVESLAAKLECKEAQELLLKEKLSKLEARLGEEGAEKLKYSMAYGNLELKAEELNDENTRKDRELLSLGEEKREAIRQLCFMIDYQRCRLEQMKSLLKMTATN